MMRSRLMTDQDADTIGCQLRHFGRKPGRVGSLAPGAKRIEQVQRRAFGREGPALASFADGPQEPVHLVDRQYRAARPARQQVIAWQWLVAASTGEISRRRCHSVGKLSSDN